MIANLILGALLSQTISVSASARALSDVLGQASGNGVRLVADGPIGDDIVAIRVDKVPLQTFMDKVAAATLGEWAPLEGGYRLTRDPAKWSAAGKDETSRRTSAVRTAITNFAEPTTNGGAFTAEAARKLGEALRDASSKLAANPSAPNVDWGALQGKSPGDRLLARVLMTVDPADLATMADGERRVWSSRPNRLQRPLGNSVTQSLAQFLNESKVWQDNKPQGLEIDALGSFGIAAHWASGPVKPTRVLLIASSWTAYSFYNVELKLLDDAGNELTGTSTTFSLAHSASKEDRLPANTANEPPLVISKQSLALRALKSRSTVEVPPEIRKVLLNPENGDPYLQVGAEVAAFLAGEQPYLAVLTDTLAPAFDSIPHNAQRNSVKFVLDRSSAVRLDESGGWLTMTPAFPMTGRTQSLERASFGQMLRQMEQRGGPAIEDLLRLSRNHSCQSPLLPYWLHGLFAETSNGNEVGAWDVYRLYDGLRASLGAGETVHLSVGRMDEDSRRRLAYLVYYSVFGNMSMGYQPPHEIGDESPYSPTSEPTEVWPNGVPSDLVLTCKRTEGPALSGVGSDYGPLDPVELGSQLAMRERPDVFPWMSEMPLPSRFVVVNRRRVDLTLAFKPDEPLAHFGISDMARTDGKQYALGSLPEAIQNAINASRDESRKIYSSLGTPAGRGGNIPPLMAP